MLFHRIRQSQSLQLTALLCFSASAATAPAGRESREQQELRSLTVEYARQGPLIAVEKFERFLALREALAQKKSGDTRALPSLGCAHGGSGGGSSGSGATATAIGCPMQRRRLASGDMSHLLVIRHWV
jgi:hypothetical protein